MTFQFIFVNIIIHEGSTTSLKHLVILFMKYFEFSDSYLFFNLSSIQEDVPSSNDKGLMRICFLVSNSHMLTKKFPPLNRR